MNADESFDHVFCSAELPATQERPGLPIDLENSSSVIRVIFVPKIGST
jgi:hypothetical protein